MYLGIARATFHVFNFQASPPCSLYRRLRLSLHNGLPPLELLNMALDVLTDAQRRIEALQAWLFKNRQHGKPQVRMKNVWRVSGDLTKSPNQVLGFVQQPVTNRRRVDQVQMVQNLQRTADPVGIAGVGYFVTPAIESDPVEVEVHHRSFCI